MTEGRSRVKITLAGSLVYYFNAWVGRLAGQDAILGIDFMVPAGIRLDLSHGTLTLPDEVQIQLSGRSPLYGTHMRMLKMGLYENIEVARSVDVMIRPSDRQQKLWLTRGERWIPTFVKGIGGLSYIRITSISDQSLIIHENMILGMWLSEGKVPRQIGYVSVGSRRYIEMQHLAYQATTDLISDEDLVDEDTSPLEKPEYAIPTKLLIRRSSVEATGESRVKKGPQVLRIFRPGSPKAAGPESENDGDEFRNDSEEKKENEPAEVVKDESEPEVDHHSDDSQGATQDNAEPEEVDPVDEQVCIHEDGGQYIEGIEKQMTVLPEVSPKIPEVTLEDLQVGEPEVSNPEQIDQLKKII